MIIQKKINNIKINKFAFFDGDNVGNTIDNLLNNGKVKEASRLSENIKLAILQIKLFVNSIDGAEVIIAGGDDILIGFNYDNFEYKLLEKLADIFTKHTGLSISCGVGDNISQAINNLASVKQTNKGIIKLESDSLQIQAQIIKETYLYIFATSDIPDPYINVIIHCISVYKNLSQVTLIGITGDPGKIKKEKSKLEKLKENILSQIDSLQDGKYLKKNDKQWDKIDIKIDSIDRQRYSEIKSLSIEIKPITYDDLEQEIANFIKNSDSILHIFDVTTVLKSYLIDIYNILRFKNISTIYSFELYSDRRTYDHKELIHNLTYKKTYNFVCLSESRFTKDKVIIDINSAILNTTTNKNISKIKSKIIEFFSGIIEFSSWIQHGQTIFIFFSTIIGIFLLIIYPKLFPSGVPEWIKPFQDLFPSSEQNQ